MRAKGCQPKLLGHGVDWQRTSSGNVANLDRRHVERPNLVIALRSRWRDSEGKGNHELDGHIKN